MTFLDGKENVMEVVFSKYGRSLLSQGKFLPSYFAFSDGDIIYDLRYAGMEQSQSQTENTILTSPRLSEPAIDSVNGYESVFGVAQSNYQQYNDLMSSIVNSNFGSLIHNSQIANEYVPSWLIKCHNDTTLTLSSGSLPTNTLTSLLRFNLEDKFVTVATLSKEMEPKNGELVTVFSDNSCIVIKDDFILLDLQEQNAPEDNEEFEYFLAYSEDEVNFKLLSMTQEQDMVRGDKLINDPRATLKNVTSTEEAVGNPDFVEYYFDVLVDSNVDEDAMRILCAEYKGQIKSGFSYLDRILNCPDKQKVNRGDVYYSGVKPEDVREKCE